MKSETLILLIAGMICATIIILVVIGCIHDTIKTTANRRSMRQFDDAFKRFVENNAANNAHLNETQQEPAPLDFPNSRIETRPQHFDDDYLNKYR